MVKGCLLLKIWLSFFKASLIPVAILIYPEDALSDSLPEKRANFPMSLLK